jgi:hypothetical protein
VKLPAIRALNERLALMAERRRANGWSAPLAIGYRTGKGLTERDFNQRWRALIAKVAAGAPELAPMPGDRRQEVQAPAQDDVHVAAQRRQRSRRRSSVSGHAIASLSQIAKHYLKLAAVTAAVVMGKLETWLEASRPARRRSQPRRSRRPSPEPCGWRRGCRPRRWHAPPDRLTDATTRPPRRAPTAQRLPGTPPGGVFRWNRAMSHER